MLVWLELGVKTKLTLVAKQGVTSLLNVIYQRTSIHSYGLV